MGSVAALRLTCHAIKNAVDHALGASAQASALYAPLDQFLVDHFFPAAAASSASAGEAVLPPVLPLLSDSAEAARTKERFRKMADLTLGVAQARLQQSRCVCAHCCVASAHTRLTSPVLLVCVCVCGGALVRW
jgi:hypothetical protein